MSDMIYRSDAIEAVGEEPEIWNDTEEEWAYHNAWVEHISAIKALPSAEPPKGDLISRDDAKQQISEWATIITKPTLLDKDATMVVLDALPSADADATMTEKVREALMRLTMCARKECGMCKYKDDCDFYFQYIISTENMHTILDALSAKAVQGDAISKQVVSDAILKKISDLNAQGEKAIPIAREFIRFKRFVDGITPIRSEAVQGEWINITNHESVCEEWECNKCGCEVFCKTNFCPSCGARMCKGGED